MKYIVCVTFKIKRNYYDNFQLLINSNAKTSLEKEDGCLQFDVCSNLDEPEHIFLYEVYTTQGAFEEHLKSEHFLVFNSKTADMIEEKLVKTYNLVN